MIPPPPMLSRDEFRRRRDVLLKEGKPLTLRNVDPAFTRWQERAHIPAWRWAVLYAAAAVLLALMLIFAVRGG